MASIDEALEGETAVFMADMGLTVSHIVRIVLPRAPKKKPCHWNSTYRMLKFALRWRFGRRVAPALKADKLILHPRPQKHLQ